MALDPSVSVAKSLFLGNIHEENITPFPRIKEEEQQTLKLVLDSIDRFMQGREVDFRKFDEKGVQPEDYIQSLRELGLFGAIIPEEFEGIGLSNTAYARMMQQSSYHDASTSLTIGAHSSIGMKGLLLFGSPEQKKKYLPKLATGEMIAAFCLTEPGSGSDAGSITTKATKNPDGSWTLNGSKIWITNGGIADFFTVFARTDSEHGKLSAFIVERGFPGVSTGNKEDKMGIRASITTTVELNNTVVPSGNLLGEEGHGFRIAMGILNNGRTGLGGGCLGGMKASIVRAVKQSIERKQFGKSIAEFNLVKGKIAQMAVETYAGESVVAMVGHYIDSGVEDYSVEAAISKVFVSECLWRVANEALQIAGGNGFMKEFPYERLVRDCRINMIFEGTNEILRLYIGLSGMKDAGQYLKGLKAAVFNDPIKGFGVLSGYAAKKLSQLTPFGNDKLSFVHSALEEEERVFELYTTRFSRAVEYVLRKYGKDIIGQQFETARIAEVAIDLFVGLCILSRVSRRIEERSEKDCHFEILMAKVFTQQAKSRMNQNILRLERNEDAELKELADHLLKAGKYEWDTV